MPKHKVLTPDETARLAAFGLAVLHILERHEDWNGDTLEEIGERARTARLSTTNNSGMFRIRPQFRGILAE